MATGKNFPTRVRVEALVKIRPSFAGPFQIDLAGALPELIRQLQKGLGPRQS